MAKGMILVRRTGSNLIAEHRNDAGDAVRKIVYGIGNNSCRGRKNTGNQFHKCQQEVADNAYYTRQCSRCNTNRPFFGLFMVFNKMSDQPFRHSFNYIPQRQECIISEFSDACG